MANIIEIDRINNIIVLGTTGTTTRLPFCTANRMVYLNGECDVTSITDLTTWITGTANQITVTDDGDGTVTLSTPQNIGTGSSPTFAGITSSDNIQFSATDKGIKANTSDGSDTFLVTVAGGGSAGNSRGAYLNVFGNEHATYPGQFWVVAGNIVDANIRFFVEGSERAFISEEGLTVADTIYLKEQASADTDKAGYAQIWSKTATPNELWFVNDVGTEIRIAPQDLQTSASPQFTGIELGHASDTTITRVSAGIIAVEGTNVMLVGDAPTAHTIASHSDTTATGANLNTLVGGGDVGALHTHAAAYQPLDAGLTSLAGLTVVSASFIKATATDTYAIRTIAETKTDLSLNLVENTALSTWVGTTNITTLGTITTGTWQATDVGIAYGGTGQSTAQLAINALTAVAAATNEHVLTKDTTTGNAIFKVIPTAADEKVKIDAAATAGYLGAANSDGVLRCSANTTGGLSYTDGGDFVTIDLAINGLTELDPPTLSQTYIPIYATGTSTQYKVLGTKLGMFVDRGDAAGLDWDETTLTEDGTWRDLDCSSVVPANAKAILFRVYVIDETINQVLRIRENGNSNTTNCSQIRTQVANQYNDGDFVVACDSGRIVEYFATNATWTGIGIVIRGWWF